MKLEVNDYSPHHYTKQQIGLLIDFYLWIFTIHEKYWYFSLEVTASHRSKYRYLWKSQSGSM